MDAKHAAEVRAVARHRHASGGTDARTRAAASWSGWRGRPVRPVRTGAAAHDRPATGPFHPRSDRPIAARTGRLGDAGAGPTAAERLRPDVPLAASAAREEEAASLIRFGEASLRSPPATRCEPPNIRPLDAGREREPSRA